MGPGPGQKTIRPWWRLRPWLLPSFLLPRRLFVDRPRLGVTDPTALCCSPLRLLNHSYLRGIFRIRRCQNGAPYDSAGDEAVLCFHQNHRLAALRHQRIFTRNLIENGSDLLRLMSEAIPLRPAECAPVTGEVWISGDGTCQSCADGRHGRTASR